MPVRLPGKSIYLDTLEREHCRKLWDAYEPELPLPSQRLNLGASREGADKWFDDIQAKQGKQQLYLGIFRADGEPIGDIQLADIDWINRTATLGAGLARREDRGKGYGTDAAVVLLRYAFRELGLYRVSGSTAEYNTAGQRSLEKLGFVKEGVRRKAVLAGGKRWDSVIYGMLAEEFADPPRHQGV